MNKVLFIILVLISLTGKAQHYTLSISAKDLSEDMGIFSTCNDELSLLLYAFDGDTATTLGAPVFEVEFVLDTHHRDTSFTFTALPTNYLLFLIERDTDKHNNQIDPLIRVQHNAIREAHRSGDYNAIDDLMGDDDVIGIHETPLVFSTIFKGRYKLDKYHYTIEIK